MVWYVVWCRRGEHVDCDKYYGVVWCGRVVNAVVDGMLDAVVDAMEDAVVSARASELQDGGVVEH